ncbi:DUF5123 domain-containing protein [Mangrovibacterium marinum]|nr:DUF5123 domain-containing protein [Mangrovibacterium marinum]
MNTLYKKYGLILVLLMAVFMPACEDVDPIVESIDFERAFTPLNVDVKVRNQINAEISWTIAQTIDHYVLEIHNDSLLFESLVLSQDVLPAEVPLTITLESEEQYSVRIKAISLNESRDESKWGTYAFKTDKENIFSPLPDANIGKQAVTLNWPAGSEVTHFMITPGDVRRDLTADEIAAGEATITDLDFATQYTVIMLNGTNPKQRGNVTFTTLPEGITLTPADDINEMITNAADGEIFLLEGGEFTAYQGTVTIDKSIKLKGLSSDNMPILNVQFVLADGAENVELESLELKGSYTDELLGPTVLDHAIQYSSNATAVGNLSLTGCYIHEYTKSLIAAGSGEFTTGDILFENCLVTEIYNDGGDFIDFRKSFPQSITLSNSTFANCATVNARDFFRLDGAAKGNSFDDGAHTPRIVARNNTFYNVMNSSSSTKRFYYVRWQNSVEELISENNIFAEMGASVYSNQGDTDMGTYSKNNYFNAAGYLDSSVNVYDNSSNYTTLDPGFADAANGDFTISNQSLIDNAVGAARWR